jgi:hypothetical protein
MAERHYPELGAVLREEAERHVPDRAAMLTRIAHRRSRPAFAALRPVAAAASVVATLVAGFAGIRLTGDRSGGAETPAAASMAPTTETPSPAPTVAPSSTPDDVTAPTRPNRTTSTTTPPIRWQPVSGFLRSAAVLDSHSNDTWAQGNLTLTTAETITTLDLVISVARTAGVRDTGKWTSVPAEMITMTVAEEKGALIYRYTLNEGRALAPGEYVFAAQYQHAAGKRDPGGDTYGAIARAGEKKAEVIGVFQG